MQKKKDEVIVIKELTITEQLEMFADILIDIYLETEQKIEIHPVKSSLLLTYLPSYPNSPAYCCNIMVICWLQFQNLCCPPRVQLSH